MTEAKGPDRPRQVTMAVVMAVVSSLVLVLGLFETLERLRTPATREAVDDFLTGTPGSSLGLETAQVVDLMRALAFVSGALAAMGLVFAIFVWQRHRGARIGLTVVAMLLLLTIPVAGLMPVFLAVSAFLLWSQPARDWYAGRDPAPVGAGQSVPVAAPTDAERGGSTRADVWPAPQVAADRDQAQPSETPPPYSQPYGQPAQEAQPPQIQTENPPYGYPPHESGASDKRPTPVTIASILTWIGGGLTALAMLAFLVVLAVNGDAFVDEFNRAARESDLTLSRDQIWAFGLAIGLTMLVWSLISVVLAVLTFRRSNGARYALAISAVMAALFSLLSIMSIVSAVTLLLAVATVVLLFTSSASQWFARRSGPAGQPPYPPYQGQPYGQEPYGQQPYGQQVDQQPPADQPPYPPADAPKRNQPW